MIVKRKAAFIDSHVVLQKSYSNGVSSLKQLSDSAGDSVHVANGYVKIKSN